MASAVLVNRSTCVPALSCSSIDTFVSEVVPNCTPILLPGKSCADRMVLGLLPQLISVINSNNKTPMFTFFFTDSFYDYS